MIKTIRENNMIYKLDDDTGHREFVGDKYLLSVSGGKDSTAMILHFKESLIEQDMIEYIFMDTGWEHYKTIEYLEYLEHEFNIKIHRVRYDEQIKEEHQDIYNQCLELINREHSDFIVRILNSLTFPNGVMKWCTTRLKIRPFNRFVKAADIEYINCVGIRREESSKRSIMDFWEYNEGFDMWVHRPLLDWVERDVIEIHRRHNIRPNPLYLEEHNRVGCYPCVMSNKQQLRAIDNNHNHIKVLRLLEQYVSDKRGKQTTFFKHDNIDMMLEWAQTSRGGQQLFLFDATSPTCEKWGMCGI